MHAGQQRAFPNAALPFYFSGHNNLDAVVDHLLNTTNLASAHRVLLSGSSAGGLGTFVNADFVADKLAPYGVSVAANPQGGFFFPAVTAYPQFVAGFLGPPYAFQNATIFDDTFNAYPNAACIAAHDPSYWCVARARVVFRRLHAGGATAAPSTGMPLTRVRFPLHCTAAPACTACTPTSRRPSSSRRTRPTPIR